MPGLSAEPLGPNPYVGPRPFKLGEPLFGRAAEVRSLFHLLNAERIVLLYSPSGAGKSSLVQAGLIPVLKQERFDVWPTIRVGTEPPPGSGASRYVMSTVGSLEEELPESLRRTPGALASFDLKQYIATRPRRRSSTGSAVLIFDQFEEILTIDPVALDAKREFFTQLGDLLCDRSIWALFVIREEYLAPLDPYAQLVPTQFKNRFRLNLLGLEAACESIREPARRAGREFAAGAAEELVHELARVFVQQMDGTVIPADGETVEPVQLQVVCRRLWDQMPAGDRVVDAEDVKGFGDVDKALGDYYEAAVALVANGDENRERAIRDWFTRKLISGRIRGQVMQGKDQTEGLDNASIFKLLDTHLIRAEKRRGATWFELAHDRLIRPVSQRNETWRLTRLDDFQRKAAEWQEQGHPDGLLLFGESLAKAQADAAARKSGLTDWEKRFLDDSRRKQDQILLAARQERDAELARKTRNRVFLDLLSKVIKYPIADTISSDSVPGEIEPLDPGWVTVVGHESQPFAIAREFGSGAKGRVLAFGHDGFLTYRDAKDSNPFLEVALTWLKGDKPASVLMSNGHREAFYIYGGPQAWPRLQSALENCQFAAEEISDLSDHARLAGAGVLIAGNSWKDFSRAELDEIVRFVEEGGGLLAVGLGWSWRDYGPNARYNDVPTPIADYPMNHLLERFGARWVETIIDVTGFR